MNELLEELFPSAPREERRIKGLTLFFPWLQTVVVFELGDSGLRLTDVFGPAEDVYSSKRRWPALDLSLDFESD